MRKLFCAVSILLAVSCFVRAQEVYTLTIDISGIKKVKGKLGICLLNDPSEFLSDCSEYNELTVTGQVLTFQKEGVKPGNYVVTIYHDANSNGILDTNLIRIPKERYGFSNNPRSAFGPPGYEKCLFEISGDTRISIKLK